MNVTTNNMNSMSINTPADVLLFFMHLTLDLRLNFHPDDDFDGFLDEDADDEIGKLTAPDCKVLNGYMERSFAVCEQYGADIYVLAQIAFNAYHQANGTEQMCMPTDKVFADGVKNLSL